MLNSYIKIACRNLLKNKMFSLINIFGLATSMSVAILLISMAHDLKMYDSFHYKKNNIYRVICTHEDQDGNRVNLATSSVMAARKIKTEIPVIKDVVTFQHGFGGELMGENKILQIKGLWAEPSFFDIFSFKLLQGDAGKALNEPNSVVLTETTARKLFGNSEAMGKTIVLKTGEHKSFIVTGILKDIPKFSHIQFDALGSFSSLQAKDQADDEQSAWTDIWSNYSYLLLRDGASVTDLQNQLTRLSDRENERINEKNEKVFLQLQPLREVAFGKSLDNQMGPNISTGMFWFIGILSIIVILSACFNYTNLSIGRSLRRSKEIGIRKVIGAGKKQIFFQLISEAVITSLLSLILAIAIFMLIRPYFLSLNPNLGLLLDLDLSLPIVFWFIMLAVCVGLIAGLLPGLFYTKLNAVSIFKNVTPLKKRRYVTWKKAFVTLQFVISLIFITSVAITFKQYKSFISFDLGFNTSNILNIKLQGNNAGTVANEISKISEITGTSKSFMITSVGNNFYTYVKHGSPDSSMAWYNKIDENYIPVLGLKLISGRNFNSHANDAAESEVIVNETLVNQFNAGKKQPAEVLGEFLEIDGKKLQIVGVVKDFHSNTVDGKIKPFLFRLASTADLKYINAKIISKDLPAVIEKLEKAWNKIDRFHPMDARFYDESIRLAYREYSSMIKIIGYLSFLAISIASLGLLGMVIISTETKQKEVTVRKIFGATVPHLMYLLSKGFVFLLILAAAIAIPVTYIIFEKVVLKDITYHSPIGFSELFSGFFTVMTLGIFLISSQTFKVATTNPANILRNA